MKRNVINILRKQGLVVAIATMATWGAIAGTMLASTTAHAATTECSTASKFETCFRAMLDEKPKNNTTMIALVDGKLAMRSVDWYVDGLMISHNHTLNYYLSPANTYHVCVKLGDAKKCRMARVPVGGTMTITLNFATKPTTK